MTDEETNVSPAGGDEGAIMPEILSLDDAAARFEQAEEANEPRAQEEAKTQPEEALTAEDDGNTGDEPPVSEDEGEAEGEEETPVDNEPVIDFDKVPGTAKFRLRDGTEVTGAEIKQRWDDLRQVDRIKQEAGQTYQQLQQRASQFAQHEQNLSQVLPLAVNVLTQTLGEPPARPAWDPTDPIGSMEAKEQYEVQLHEYQQKAQTLQRLQHEQAQRQQMQQRQWQEGRARFIHEQREKLLEKIPDLRDPEKLEKFRADAMDIGAKAYGFTAQEMSDGPFLDHRHVLMARDAIAYRKLMSKKPAPKPAAPAAAAKVAQPGRRVSETEAKATERDELFQRARSQGGVSVDEATRLAMKLGI